MEGHAGERNVDPIVKVEFPPAEQSGPTTQ
jgi:hypothetical protein